MEPNISISILLVSRLQWTGHPSSVFPAYGPKSWDRHPCDPTGQRKMNEWIVILASSSVTLTAINYIDLNTGLDLNNKRWPLTHHISLYYGHE